VFSPTVHADENAETTNTEKLTESDSKSNDEVEVNSYENVSINTIAENSELEEDDFEVIQGDGTLTYNDDGSVTFGVDSNEKNKIVYNQADEIKDGIFEADIKADKNLNRFGFIYRVQDTSEYKYVGTGDENNQYFSEIFGEENNWTSMTKGIPLEADKTYRLRIKFIDDMAALYIDDEKIGSWSQAEGVDRAGAIGFEKSRGAANITISNVKVEEYDAPNPPETDPVEQVLSSDYMDV